MHISRYLASIATVGALTLVASAAQAQRRHADGAAASALSNRDSQDADGHFFRSRSVPLLVGESVTIAVDSSEFDTVLHVTGPDFDATNDDAEGQGTNSRLTFQVATAGVYQVTVTSYNAGETGNYSLSIQHATGAAASPDRAADGDRDPNQSATIPTENSAPAPQGWAWDDAQHMFVPTGAAPGVAAPVVPVDPSPSDGNGSNNPFVTNGAAVGGTGTVYGVFVGVSNYGGGNDLDDTANDARNLAGAFERVGLIHHGNAIVLTDDEATTDQVRQAFETLGPRVTEHDTFVFFFDGHGDTNEVELQSGPATARDIGQLLDGIRGEQLLVLDSCYSGSIASIVRGHANRVGLFSSRANETSYVASPVHAGGWLAYFMIEAVRERVSSRDGSLHLADLVSYVQHGYAERVHGQQHLVFAAAARTTTLWHSPGRSESFALAR